MTNPSKVTLSNGRAAIGGCTYKSIVNLNNYAYILLNDVTKLELSSTARRRRSTSTDSTLKEYSLPSYEITNFSQQGYFQYVIYDKYQMSKEVKSAKTPFININGNYYNKLIVSMFFKPSLTFSIGIYLAN